MSGTHSVASLKSGNLLESWQWGLLILSTLLKLSLMGTYHSTDFEVHRNWLAITHSLPLSQWYFDQGSKWTLDYPPFFAYLSWLLSIPAARWDPRIVDLKGGLEYDDWSCKVFMRFSVIVTELTFITALFALSKPSKAPGANPKHTIPAWAVAALILHPGLIIIDHIHFQYNGFLYGVLFWSIWAAREGRPLLCAFLFSSLLNFKHIYVYIAPAFFVFLLQSYVIKGQSDKNTISFSGAGERLFTLGTITLIPFAASLTPLLLSGLTSTAPAGPIGILKQMVSRLFPFSRGLNHAYWAANAWALYTFADRALVKLLGVTSEQGNVTRGILGDTHFDVLPQISAGHCFLLTLVFTLLLCTRLWTRPAYGTFVESIALFGLTSFLFGFHVHEKAILIALLPLTLLSACSYTMMRKTLILSVAGVVGLFPLLFEAQELPIKIVWTLLWLIKTPFSSTLGLRFSSSQGYFDHHTPTNVDLLIHFAEDAYIAGFIPLVIFVEFVHPVIFGKGAFGLYSSPTSSFKDILSESSITQNKLLSFASAAASSAVDAIGQAVGQSVSTQGNVEGIASSASSAASLASSAASSIVNAATASISSPSSNQVEQIVAQAASSASSIASQAISKTTNHAILNAAAQISSIDEPKYAFLPLMMTSIYCAIGVVWVWFSSSARFLRGTDDVGDEAAQASSNKKTIQRTNIPSVAAKASSSIGGKSK